MPDNEFKANRRIEIKEELYGNWPLKQVFNFGEELAGGEKLAANKLLSGDSVWVKGRVMVRYDKENNSVVFYRLGEGNPIVSLVVEDENILGIKADIEGSYKEVAEFFFDILSSGLIKESFVAHLHFPPEFFKEVSEKAKEVIDIRRMNKEKPGIEKLRNVSRSSAANPYVVIQGQAAIMEKNSPYDALYTFGAGPCSILAAAVRNEKGEVEKVALAHLDGVVTKKDIRKLLGIINFNSKDIEISIISGDENLVLNIYEVLKESDNLKNIRYFDADLSGTRNDSLTITKEGEIFYGENAGWNQWLSG